MKKKYSKANIKQRRKRYTLLLFSIFVLTIFLIIGTMLTIFASMPSRYDLTQTRVGQNDLTYQQYRANEVATQEAQLAQGLPTNKPVDAFSLTATALIGRLTEDAQTFEARNHITRQPPPDNFQLTATALIGQLTEDARLAQNFTPTSVLDYSAKATAIIVQQTHEVEEGVKTKPNQNAFSLTATALIGQLTRDALIIEGIELGIITLEPTRTPAPTATFVPYDVQKVNWVNHIEQNLGFSHPIIEDVITELMSQDKQGVQNKDFGLSFTIPHKFEPIDYDAVLIQAINRENLQIQGRLLVFYKTEDSIELIYDRDVGESEFLLFGHEGVKSYFREFSDINNNGLKDLVFAHSNGTQCPKSRLGILEFDGDEIRDISPLDNEFFDGDSHFEFVPTDFNDDGTYEIIYRFPHIYKGDVANQTAPCKISNEVFRYEWNGERYTLVDQD